MTTKQTRCLKPNVLLHCHVLDATNWTACLTKPLGDAQAKLPGMQKVQSMRKTWRAPLWQVFEISDNECCNSLPTTAPGAFFCLHHLLLSLVFFGCFESKISCFSVWRCSWRPCARIALAPARRVSGAPGATPSQRRNGTDATPAEL